MPFRGRNSRRPYIFKPARLQLDQNMSDLGTRLNHLYNLMGVVDLTYVMFVGKKICSIFKKYILEKKNLIVIKF